MIRIGNKNKSIFYNYSILKIIIIFIIFINFKNTIIMKYILNNRKIGKKGS